MMYLLLLVYDKADDPHDHDHNDEHAQRVLFNRCTVPTSQKVTCGVHGVSFEVLGQGKPGLLPSSNAKGVPKD